MALRYTVAPAFAPVPGGGAAAGGGAGFILLSCAASWTSGAGASIGIKLGSVSWLLPRELLTA